MLAILDYKVGNLASVQNMVRKVGGDCIITNNPNELEQADKIILPGVGSFDYCAKQLALSPCLDVLKYKALENKIPTLGICVGHQLLFNSSEEGVEKGLGWINGEVIKFKKEQLPADYKIPNMGWCELNVVQQNELFKNIEEPRFYFCHSFHAAVSDSLVVATASYGYEFIASVQQGNIFGCQFHPEKSLKNGMAVLKNFINL